MTSPLLLQLEGVVALPDPWFVLDQRRLEGLVWDPQGEAIVPEALPTVTTVPPSDGFHVEDEGKLLVEARQACAEAETMEAPAIYGGFLLRHFGHFLHESLSRLWWLAPSDAMQGEAKDAALRLRQLDAEVVFFMPKWLDEGKSLLPYMEQILFILGLPAQRIRILQSPLRFRQLAVPASVWGFGTDPLALDQRLGCDTRALMRQLHASAAVPSAMPAISGAAPSAPEASGNLPAEKVYVTRSGLPISLGRLIGDVVLDPLLADAGYSVFHPERASIADQIRVYSQAKDLIFMDGSSLYVLWFSKLRPGARVRVILRRRQGRWMCDKVRELLPDAAHIQWELVDALQGEAVTSDRDWESHNVADLASLLGQLGCQAPPALPVPAREALASYVQTLAQQSSPDQLAKVLEALIAVQATTPGATPSRRERLMRKARGLFTSP